MGIPTSLIDNDVDIYVRNQLHSLDRDFFHCLAGETDTVAFMSSWRAFEDTVTSCRERLQTETITMVYTSAMTIATVTSGMLKSESDVNDSISPEFAEEFKQILEEGMRTLSVEDVCNDESNGDIPNATSYPPYIKPSYTWLLENLHNPYPSKVVKEAISLETSASLKDIDSWFIDARKRMGWNELRKARFSNKRADIIDAATRFFVKEDPKRCLTSDIELDFVKIQHRARELYSEKFLESALAMKLDVAIKDVTPEIKAEVKAKERKRKQLEKEQKKMGRGARAYPSPERSPGRSPEPLTPASLFDTGDLSDLIVEEFSSRKRSCSPDEDRSAGDHRPTKRIRIDPAPLSDGSSIQCLPSPAPSMDGAHEVAAELPSTEESPTLFSNTANSSPAVSLPSIPAVPSISTPALSRSTKRKRRLSESDGNSAPKRPCGIPPPAPRLQTVSDPIPWEFLKGSEFDKACSSPVPPVSVEQLDPQTDYEVELFDHAAFQAQQEWAMGTQTRDGSSSNIPATPYGEEISYIPIVEESPGDTPTFALNQSEYWPLDDMSHMVYLSYDPASYDAGISSYGQGQGNTFDNLHITDSWIFDSISLDALDPTIDTCGQNMFNFFPQDSAAASSPGMAAAGLLLSQPSQEEQSGGQSPDELEAKMHQLEEEFAQRKAELIKNALLVC